MARDKCYVIDTRMGPMRVRAGKKPSKKTVEALEDLFAAAVKFIESQKPK